MSALVFIDQLTQQLIQAFPTYVVKAQEPPETNLKARTQWVATDSIEQGVDIADLGESVGIVVPVFIVTVMSVPATPAETRETLKRRLSVIQAAQRTCRTFVPENDALVMYIGESAVIGRDFYISTVQINVQYSLQAEGEPQ